MLWFSGMSLELMAAIIVVWLVLMAIYLWAHDR